MALNTPPATPSDKYKLDAAQRQALMQIVESGPDLDQHGVVRWRLKDLAAWVYASFGVSLDESRVDRMVKRMGFRKLSVRPRHHEQDPAAVKAIRAGLPAGTAIEVWWQAVLRQAQDEDVWPFMRDNWLGDRIFASYDDRIDICCDVWNRLIDQPRKIMSLGLRSWADRV